MSKIDPLQKGQSFQVRVKTKADADALLKDMMGGNIDRYKNHVKHNSHPRHKNYDVGYEVHQQGLEGDTHDLFHIKWYNYNAKDHIFYDITE